MECVNKQETHRALTPEGLRYRLCAAERRGMQAGLLACSDTIVVSAGSSRELRPSDISGSRLKRDFLTAAGTAADFHSFPY